MASLQPVFGREITGFRARELVALVLDMTHEERMADRVLVPQPVPKLQPAKPVRLRPTVQEGFDYAIGQIRASADEMIDSWRRQSDHQ